MGGEFPVLHKKCSGVYCSTKAQNPAGRYGLGCWEDAARACGAARWKGRKSGPAYIVFLSV